MIISKEDKEESLKVVQLIKKIELIDENYVNRESDNIKETTFPDVVNSWLSL